VFRKGQNKMNRIKIAIPIKGDKGLENSVSDVFGKAHNFVVVEVENGSIVGAKVVKNPAASYKHGSGPIAVKMLTDMKVNVAAGREFGLGVSTLLEQNKIEKIKVKTGIPVKEAIQKILEQSSKKS
jgi:predicted Fe-Mo cluster-binding NifX family protein